MTNSTQTLDAIGKGDISTISGLFAERVRRNPDKVAYRQRDAAVGWRGYTWREMDAADSALADCVRRERPEAR